MSNEPIQAMEGLTDRQFRELEYHREHAKHRASMLLQPFPYDVAFNKKRRWWNGYWGMYSLLMRQPLAGRKVLVVGCGFGDDALRLAKMGAEVSAFDLSPESLEIAQSLAKREGLQIDFQQMPAERLNYPSDTFDFVLACDILHHVEIPQAMAEIVRVSKPQAIFIANELYSHSFTDKIRHSSFVEKKLYPAMQSFIYQNAKPYITEDERKLTEQDMKQVLEPLARVIHKEYFYLFVTRLLPDKYKILSQIDKVLVTILSPFGTWLAGRILLAGVIRK
ncbi:MAG TPA: class I SAM-dependent methyltransferase [Blastocatellia bacterium]|nr:class I SAM-dependent methyltransferase [Blastocatellia bacterium]